jgi:hypothetical protein
MLVPYRRRVLLNEILADYLMAEFSLFLVHEILSKCLGVPQFCSIRSL